MKKFKLFHFDIRTFGNYGDTLLFETVRTAFQSFADGQAFDVYDSAPLRSPVTHAMVERINATADAVVIGGGGLFLGDRHDTTRSGWQWNISPGLLAQIDKPLIVFAVGNNRFIGQPDFGELFQRHLAMTVEKSIFFGLRNHGSMRTIAEHLPPSLHDRIVHQPCTTTIASHLYPDLARPVSDERVLGVQATIDSRQSAAGFSADLIGRESIDALRLLRSEGWQVHSVPHSRADAAFATKYREAGVVDRETRLYGEHDGLFRGVELFPDLPVIYGTRGHAQMVPFGMGSIPLSALVHDKLRYFLEDIERPQWAIDPREPGFARRMHRAVSEAYEGREDHRAHLAGMRRSLYDLTLDNLAAIYASLGGERPEPSLTPYTPRERRLAEKLFIENFRKSRLNEKLAETREALQLASESPQQDGRSLPLRSRVSRALRRLRRRS